MGKRDEKACQGSDDDLRVDDIWFARMQQRVFAQAEDDDGTDYKGANFKDNICIDEMLETGMSIVTAECGCHLNERQLAGVLYEVIEHHQSP